MKWRFFSDPRMITSERRSVACCTIARPAERAVTTIGFIFTLNWLASVTASFRTSAAVARSSSRRASSGRFIGTSMT